jgi:hypothetical protein
MKRQRFLHEFAIILLLVVSIGVIAFQTNSHFTGFAVFNQYTTETDCIAAGHTWTDITGLQNVTSQIEVVTGGSCSNIDYTDEANCILNSSIWTNTTELQNVTSETQIEVVTGGNCTGIETNETCIENWSCTGWGTCSNSNQTRTCTDSASCGTISNKPSIIQSCTMPIVCTEDWKCENWSVCENGNQTRTCTDNSSCGTSVHKPSIKRSCTVATSSTPVVTTTPVTAEVTQTCTPTMQCGDWQECINSTQIRICTDVNKCNPDEVASTESQACVEEIKETCSDKIKNQDETGIDCGGKCKKCGFFTIVGSVVSGTVNSVLGNKTRIFIFAGSLLVLVGGFFAFKFFSKKRRLKTKSK